MLIDPQEALNDVVGSLADGHVDEGGYARLRGLPGQMRRVRDLAAVSSKLDALWHNEVAIVAASGFARINDQGYSERLLRGVRVIISSFATRRSLEALSRSEKQSTTDDLDWISRFRQDIANLINADSASLELNWQPEDELRVFPSLGLQVPAALWPNDADAHQRLLTALWWNYWDTPDAPVGGIPVIAVDGQDPVVAHFDVIALEGLTQPSDEVGGVLLEHPDNALLALGPDLLSTIENAWTGAKNGRDAEPVESVAWRLRAVSKPPLPPLDGSSLGAAVRARFDTWVQRLPHDPDVAVLAVVQGDSPALAPVACSQEKTSLEDAPYTFVVADHDFDAPRDAIFATTITDVIERVSGGLARSLEMYLGHLREQKDTSPWVRAGDQEWIVPSLLVEDDDSEQKAGSAAWQGLERERRVDLNGLVGSLRQSGSQSFTVVEGTPGSGKTTLLREIAAQMANTFAHAWNIAGRLPLEHPIPIRLNSWSFEPQPSGGRSAWAITIQSAYRACGLPEPNNRALLEQLAAWINSSLPSQIDDQSQRNSFVGWLVAQVSTGHAVLLVDAADQPSEEVGRFLEQAVAEFTNANVVFAGRPEATGRYERRRVARIAGLTRREIEAFVVSYFRNDDFASKTLNALKHAPGIAENPLLLTLFCYTRNSASEQETETVTLTTMYTALIEHLMGRTGGPDDQQSLIPTLGLALWSLMNETVPPRGPIRKTPLYEALQQRAGWNQKELEQKVQDLQDRRILMNVLSPGNDQLLDTAHPSVFEYLVARGQARAICNGGDDATRAWRCIDATADWQAWEIVHAFTAGVLADPNLATSDQGELASEFVRFLYGSTE